VEALLAVVEWRRQAMNLKVPAVLLVFLSNEYKYFMDILSGLSLQSVALLHVFWHSHIFCYAKFFAVFGFHQNIVFVTEIISINIMS